MAAGRERVPNVLLTRVRSLCAPRRRPRCSTAWHPLRGGHRRGSRPRPGGTSYGVELRELKCERLGELLGGEDGAWLRRCREGRRGVKVHDCRWFLVPVGEDERLRRVGQGRRDNGRPRGVAPNALSPAEMLTNPGQAAATGIFWPRCCSATGRAAEDRAFIWPPVMDHIKMHGGELAGE